MSRPLATPSDRRPDEPWAYCFGSFRVDLPRRLLWRNGEVVELPPRVVDTLVALLVRAGEDVSRHDLIEAVWPEEFISDHALTQAISLLRQALGDTAADRRFIQTVSRRGYRFIHPVVAEAPPAPGTAKVGKQQGVRVRRAAAVAGGILAVTVALGLDGHSSIRPQPRSDQIPDTARSPALEEYLQGRYALELRTAGDYRRALEHFRRAVELDPGLAVAHAGMAKVYSFIGGPAEQAALRALELDPNCADAHAALGFYRLVHHDWSASRASLRRAIEADPEYAQAHHWYAYSLLAVGRRGEAIKAMRRARDLDPVSLIRNTDLGNILMLAGRVEEGLEQLEEALRLDPRYGVAYWRAGDGYLFLGDTRRAGASYRRAFTLGVDAARFWVATLDALAGDRQAALERVAGEHDDPAYVAMVHTALGDHETALELLERARQEKPGGSMLLLVDPFFDALRGDSRFEALLRRMDLPVELSQPDPVWARVRQRLSIAGLGGASQSPGSWIRAGRRE